MIDNSGERERRRRRRFAGANKRRLEQLVARRTASTAVAAWRGVGRAPHARRFVETRRARCD
jgi:hypothetical protein